MASEDRLNRDVVFDLLNSSRRRMVLSYLREHGREITVTELAGQIAAMEHDTDVESLSREQRKRVYVSLYQTHIPKLADAGVVDYDPETGTVEPTERIGDIDAYLAPGPTDGYPWHLHYLALSAVGLLAFALLVAGVPPIAAIPPTALGVLVAIAVGLSAIAQAVTRRRERTAPNGSP